MDVDDEQTVKIVNYYATIWLFGMSFVPRTVRANKACMRIMKCYVIPREKNLCNINHYNNITTLSTVELSKSLEEFR